MEPRSDADLLTLARAGDPTAREALLVRHAPDVLRWARGTCRDAHDGEDVAQDVLVTAARHLGDLRDGDAIGPWLRTVTRNTCARRRRRRAGAPAAFDPVDDALPHPGPAPDAALDGPAIERALAGLDPKYRAVLVLRDVEGLTAPEVAEVLGLRVDTVKTRLHRARAALREVLAPTSPSPGCPDLAGSFSRYLEGELDEAACDALHAHVAGCPRCDAACDALRDAIGACRSTRRPLPDAREHVRRALRVALPGPADRPRRHGGHRGHGGGGG